MQIDPKNHLLCQNTPASPTQQEGISSAPGPEEGSETTEATASLPFQLQHLVQNLKEETAIDLDRVTAIRAKILNKTLGILSDDPQERSKAAQTLVERLIHFEQTLAHPAHSGEKLS